MVPLRDYNLHKGKNSGGPNFHTKPIIPYFWKGSQYDSLLEIPVSAFYPIEFFKKDFFKKKFGKKIANRLGIGRLLSLNPSFTFNFNETIIKSDIKNKKLIINLFLHSSELALNCSPFTYNSDDHKKVWLILEKTFKYIKKNGIKSLTLTEAGKCIRNKIK